VLCRAPQPSAKPKNHCQPVLPNVELSEEGREGEKGREGEGEGGGGRRGEGEGEKEGEEREGEERRNGGNNSDFTAEENDADSN